MAKDNDKGGKLSHSVDGVTTRDDATDLGVPMKAGKADEAVGPEDALGFESVRGDYSGRIGGPDYNPHTSEVIPEGEREENGPIARVVRQREGK